MTATATRAEAPTRGVVGGWTICWAIGGWDAEEGQPLGYGPRVQVPAENPALAVMHAERQAWAWREAMGPGEAVILDQHGRRWVLEHVRTDGSPAPQRLLVETPDGPVLWSPVVVRRADVFGGVTTYLVPCPTRWDRPASADAA